MWSGKRRVQARALQGEEQQSTWLGCTGGDREKVKSGVTFIVFNNGLGTGIIEPEETPSSKGLSQLLDRSPG